MIYVSLDTETWGKRAGFDLRSIGAVVLDPIHGYVAGVDAHEMPESVLRNSFYLAVDNPAHPTTVSDPSYPVERITDKNGAWYFDGVEAFRKYPLKRDPGTVQWWSEQSAEAQAAFANPVDLREALMQLSLWLHDVTREARRITPPRYIDGLRHSDGYVDQIDAAIVGVDHDQYIPLHKFTGLRIYCHGPQFDLSIVEAAYHACGLEAPWNYRTPRDTRTLFDAAGIDDDGDGSFKTFMSQHNIGTAHHAQDDAIAQALCVVHAMGIIRGLNHTDMVQAFNLGAFTADELLMMEAFNALPAIQDEVRNKLAARFNKPTGQHVEIMGAALAKLSERLKLDGFLDRDDNRNAYEAVVKAWEAF